MLDLRKAKALLAALTKSGGALGRWALPDLSLLPDVSCTREAEYQPPINIEQSAKVLRKYGVDAAFKDYMIGPSVTTFVYEVPIGTRLSNLDRCLEDIARDLGVSAIRITQVVGRTSSIGIEVENIDKYPVPFKDIAKANRNESPFAVPLGEDTFGELQYIDITEQPHLMVAGQTGSGKSVFLNTTVASLISRCMPKDLKLLLIDPKQVEFSQYRRIPHLMAPIACDLEEAYGVVDFAVEEMGRRFDLFSSYSDTIKKIEDYNEQVPADKKLPRVVLVIDEFADLMMMGTAKERKEVENKIARIAQKARAVGIHLILATQKPLVTVVTSLIKANITAQIAFKVQKSIDSKVILDDVGAEHLAGKGDLLFTGILASGKAVQLKRVQASFLSDSDLEQIIQGGLNAN